jgi:hypothetical protein
LKRNGRRRVGDRCFVAEHPIGSIDVMRKLATLFGAGGLRPTLGAELKSRVATHASSSDA